MKDGMFGVMHDWHHLQHIILMLIMTTNLQKLMEENSVGLDVVCILHDEG